MSPLPRGRHDLTPDQVVEDQRRRLLAACLAVVGEEGYARATVARIVARAGVSRQTFYAAFDSREDCFLAAFDDLADGLIAVVRDRAARGDTVRDLLGGYLEALAADPALTRVLLVEVYAAGPAAVHRRARVQARFAALARDVLPGPADAPALLALELLVGGVGGHVSGLLADPALDDAAVAARIRALADPLHAVVERLAGAQSR